MEYVIIIIVIIVIAAFIGIAQGKAHGDAWNKTIKDLGIDLEKRIPVGSYIHGHPDIDNPHKNTFLYHEKDKIIIYGEDIKKEHELTLPKKLSSIGIKNIKDITIEDATTIEKKMTVARIALVGLFAFALKKEQKNEMTYLVIKWKDGKYEHETIFELVGAGSLQAGNTARNKLIKITK